MGVWEEWVKAGGKPEDVMVIRDEVVDSIARQAQAYTLMRAADELEALMKRPGHLRPIDLFRLVTQWRALAKQQVP